MPNLKQVVSAGVTFLVSFKCSYLAARGTIQRQRQSRRDGSSCECQLQIWCMQAQSTRQALDIASVLQVLDAVSEDFQSRIWMTYRRGFAPLGRLSEACR